MKEEQKILLEGLGFEQTKDKLFKKVLESGDSAFWDFRKTDKGNFYVSLKSGDFMKDEDAKQLPEYVDFRRANNGYDKKETKKPILVEKPNVSKAVVLRGNESEISRVVQSRRLDMIIKASSDPKQPGKGILYYDEKIGDFHLIEPSVECIDMVIADMGNIETELIEHGQRRYIDIDTGDEYQTYYAIVKAIDKTTGTIGIGSSEEIVNFKEMARIKNPRTFTMTKAIRKAGRNACERLIPVPRKALVELLKETMNNYIINKKQGVSGSRRIE